MSYYMTRTSPGRLSPVSAEEMSGKLLNMGETVGTTVLFGALVGYNAAKGVDAKKQMPSLVGIPLDLGVGVVGHLIDMLGFVDRQTGRHIHAIANGALASYGVGLGNYLGGKVAGAASTTPPGDGTGGGWDDYRDAYARALREANPHFSESQIASIVASRA